MAVARIFQGTNAHPPINAARIWPRRKLMYFGQRVIRSTAAEIELAEIFVPMILIAKPAEAKKTAARLSHSAKMSAGFQRNCPYKTLLAEVVAIPKKATMVNTTGMMMICTYCARGDLAYRVKSATLTARVQ
jgi:hypothetical protein